MNDAQLGALRAALPGRLLAPGDDGFEQAAMPWNLAVAQHPAAVAMPADAADIVALVRLARENGFVLSAQPGGHGATGAANDTVLVRTGSLDEVVVDADAGVAQVGAGVKWGRLLAELDGTGLIGLAGSNPDVSVTGYLLGGGMSWFGRRYGMAAGAVRAVELVDGTGEHRRVTDESDPDLMWALRGGGGEFGIVTRIELDLPREPELHGGKLMFPIGGAAPVLEAYASLMDDAPDGLTCWASLMHFPDAPFLPEPLRGQSFTVVDVTWLGPAPEAEALLAPLRAAAPVLDDSFGPLPIGRLGEVAAEPTDPTPAIEWMTPLSAFDADTVRRLLEVAGDRTRTAVVAVQVRRLGGAFVVSPWGRPAATERLEAAYIVHAFGVPMVPELVGPIQASLAGLATAFAPVAGGRVPPTFLLSGMPLSASHGDATLARLREVKLRVDPAGVIRGNHPLG